LVLALFKAPHSVTFIEELPKTANRQDSEIRFARTPDSNRSAVSDAGIGEQDNEGSGADSVLLCLIGWSWWFALRPFLRFGPPTRCFARDQFDANEPTSAYKYNGMGQLDGRVVKICY
jgi:hypothetical protein